MPRSPPLTYGDGDIKIEESRPCVLTHPPFLSLSTNLSVYDIANVHTRACASVFISVETMTVFRTVQ